jgi:probable blue pigment (indigoidine) exporter
VEGTLRWSLVTALAPVAWGTTYYVTRQFLPEQYPLYGAAIRALPAGLVLLALSRKLPSGSWWWKSLVLGTLNVGAFFVLIYLAAQLLPSSIAATIMATSPVVLMLLAWAFAAERPRLPPLLGAGLGILGVVLMLLTGVETITWPGVLASVTALVMSSFGYVLAKRWGGQVDVLTSSAWQLVAGGLLLTPVAVLVEGAPPALDVPALLGFAYSTLVATALAFVAWFAGLRHLPAATVGLIGLLNPVTGVLLGVVVAAESLTARQVCGLALVLAGVLLGQKWSAWVSSRSKASARVTSAVSGRPNSSVTLKSSSGTVCLSNATPSTTAAPPTIAVPASSSSRRRSRPSAQPTGEEISTQSTPSTPGT